MWNLVPEKNQNALLIQWMGYGLLTHFVSLLPAFDFFVGDTYKVAGLVTRTISACLDSHLATEFSNASSFCSVDIDEDSFQCTIHIKLIHLLDEHNMKFILYKKLQLTFNSGALSRHILPTM